MKRCIAIEVPFDGGFGNVRFTEVQAIYPAATRDEAFEISTNLNRSLHDRRMAAIDAWLAHQKAKLNGRLPKP